jgi:hypothetical protein
LGGGGGGGAVEGGNGGMDAVVGEDKLVWGCGGVVTGVQRWQVLTVVEEMAAFWENSRGNLIMAEILYRRALELSEKEAHPHYQAAAAKHRLALAKIGWEMTGNFSAADMLLRDVIEGVRAAAGGGAGGAGGVGNDMGWRVNEVEFRNLELEALAQRAVWKEEVCVCVCVGGGGVTPAYSFFMHTHTHTNTQHTRVFVCIYIHVGVSCLCMRS